MSFSLSTVSPPAKRFSVSALWYNLAPSKKIPISIDSIGAFNNENLVWKSFGVSERETFERLRRGTGKASFCAKDSPFLPRTFREYVDHRVEYLKDQIAALKCAITLFSEQSNVEVMPAFGGKKVGLSDWAGFHPFERVLANPLDDDEEFRAGGEQLLGEELLREI